MNRAALLRLADKLQSRGDYEGTPFANTHARFDMGDWMVGRVTDIDCGYTACAIGHAGLDPWFQVRGFEIAPSFAKNQSTPSYTKDGHEHRGFYAVMEYFGINLEEAEYLFGRGAYAHDVKPEEVGERVRKYVAGRLALIPVNYAVV